MCVVLTSACVLFVVFSFVVIVVVLRRQSLGGGGCVGLSARPRQSNLQPQKAEEGDFTDLEGFDLQTKLALLRKNEQWKCQVKQEALEVR